MLQRPPDFFIRDVGESVLASKNKRAEELIQVHYLAILIKEPLFFMIE